MSTLCDDCRQYRYECGHTPGTNCKGYEFYSPEPVLIYPIWGKEPVRIYPVLDPGRRRGKV